MFQYEYDKDITSLTTFGIPVKAKIFAEYTNERELLKICRSEEYLSNRVLHIGGGSNLLFERDFNGLVLHSGIRGIKTYSKNDATEFVIAGAGENWADFVDFCVKRGLAGVENLAGIPGEVGASPVQNVGAYGVEAADVIHAVECLDRTTLKVVEFFNDYKRNAAPGAPNTLGFGYRASNFKTTWKDRYIVLRVAFRLRKSTKAANVNYGGLKGLAERLGHEPTIREVCDEVISIRNQKLPDPNEIGSAGSFFKNPILRRKYYEFEVLNLDPAVPHYNIPGDEEHVKVPAGWLIEHAGLKGAKIGGAIVYPMNCLVLANAGNATAADVMALSKMVCREVNAKFHIPLFPEVNCIDSTIKVTVLGSGTSKGVPELMCDCRVCRSKDPRDKRLRASVLVQTMGLNILIDPSPDFREQALREDIRNIDAVLITHEHYDHVGGIDDLRPFCFSMPVEMYLKGDVNEKLHKRLDYCFSDKKYPGVPSFGMHIVGDRPFFVKGLEITPIEVFHGKLPILGFRIGKFAYVTDAKRIDESERDKLRDLDVLILNALRKRDHFAHFTIAEALELIEDVKPKRVYLTHLCHEVGLHDEFDASLPDHVSPAYDGLQILVS